MTWMTKFSLVVPSLLFSISLKVPLALASSVPMPPGQVIDRLSIKLRGHPPTLAEKSEFVAAVTTHPEDFMNLYEEKVETYLESPEFEEVVRLIHSIWWRVPQGESTQMAGYIVANDRPYFEFLYKDYLYLDGATAAAYNDMDLAALSPIPSEPLDWRAVRLSPKESRFRTLFSHLDFLNAYPDTATNKNRKRANQIFHTFLCENLAPTTPTTAEQATIKDQLDPNDPHGTDPNCIGCHYRLDPMARFFDRWRPPFPDATKTWFDSSRPAKGKIIVIDTDGSHRSQLGATETQLGQLLAADPKVHTCAAKQAWNYLMGQDVILDSATSKSLVATLDSRQNYKDLVRETVLHKFFWSRETPPPVRFSDVKDSFLVCASCHQSAGIYFPQFDPLNYPFGYDTASNATLLKSIWGAINHAPNFKPMPLAPIPALPADAISKIRSWIAAGANDDTSHPTLNATQMNEVLSDD